MTNQAYLKALKKALAGMDSASRDEIIREIESYIAEAGADAQSLNERFGTPEMLAQQYLDGETLRTPMADKAGGMLKRVLMWLGGSVLVLALLITALVYWFTRDDFDYADENAAALSDASRNWVDVALTAPPVFKVEQSKTVFYWLACCGAGTLVMQRSGYVGAE
ncbi:MAG: hypothetical protein R3F02_21955 [Thiolinea sp.]